MPKSARHALRNARRIAHELQALEFNTQHMPGELSQYILKAKGAFQLACRQLFLQGDLVKRALFDITFRQYVRAFGNYYPVGFVAALAHDPARRQYFDLQCEHPFTAREAFNLLEGRCVHRLDKEQQTGGAWYSLDFTAKDHQENYQYIRHPLPEPGYVFPKHLLDLPVQQLTLRQWRTTFLASLRKGDRVAATLEKERGRQVFVEMDGRTFELLLKDRAGNRIHLKEKHPTRNKRRKRKM